MYQTCSFDVGGSLSVRFQLFLFQFMNQTEMCFKGFVFTQEMNLFYDPKFRWEFF